MSIGARLRARWRRVAAALGGALAVLVLGVWLLRRAPAFTELVHIAMAVLLLLSAASLWQALKPRGTDRRHDERRHDQRRHE